MKILRSWPSGTLCRACVHVPVLYETESALMLSVKSLLCICQFSALQLHMYCTVCLSAGVSGIGNCLCLSEPRQICLCKLVSLCACVFRPGPQRGVDSRAVSNVCSHEESACLAAASACWCWLWLGFLCTTTGVSTHSHAALYQGSARLRVQQTSSESFQTRHASSLSGEYKCVLLSWILHWTFYTQVHSKFKQKVFYIRRGVKKKML